MDHRVGTGQPHQPVRPWPLILTAGGIGLAALAVAATESYLAAVVVATILALTTIFRTVFRSSRAFCLTLANLTSVYACLFLFFAETNFAQASFLSMSLAFAMPPLAFVLGSLWYRTAIELVTISDRMREERHLLRIFSWLIPVFSVGALSFLLPEKAIAGDVADLTLLGAMTAISLFVAIVSRDIAVFLLDTGLVFEEFFRRAARLAVPAFAFLTCYSSLVIVFAALYSVIDHVSGGMNFRIDGKLRAIDFPESLYFSLMTLSTVGYGDISPASRAMRVVASGEIVCGILLLLFGFNEIFSFARNREQPSQTGRPRGSGR